ncbi:hypothetical protein HDU93_003947 [Gonapodya sp. JEL0774]|nr:hypothetical protein HDU93_003947 [Gonapodya sp. JEL0774]
MTIKVNPAHVKKLKSPLKIRPRKEIAATPCAVELTTLFNCWRSFGVDTPNCLMAAKGVTDCVAKSRATGGKKSTDEINYWLNQLGRKQY